jgi:hypothetical protein
MRPPAPDGVIRALAAGQDGVVARWQLLAAGVAPKAIDHRVRTGRLIVLHRGVYALGHRALRRRAWWLAGALACGPRAVVSYQSGGSVWGLLEYSGANVHVTVTHGTHRVPGLVIHRTRRLDERDVTLHDDVPVTSVARTLLDLADVVPRRRLEKAVDQAEVLCLFDLRAVEDVLSRSRGRRGRTALSAIVGAYRPGAALTRSELEDLFLSLVDGAALPRPEVNVHVEGFVVDFLWRAERLIVEVDGYAFHSSRRAFRDDRSRDRRLQRAGYVVVRFTYADIVTGSAANEVRETLERVRARA